MVCGKKPVEPPFLSQHRVWLQSVSPFLTNTRGDLVRWQGKVAGLTYGKLQQAGEVTATPKQTPSLCRGLGRRMPTLPAFPAPFGWTHLCG